MSRNADVATALQPEIGVIWGFWSIKEASFLLCCWYKFQIILILFHGPDRCRFQDGIKMERVFRKRNGRFSLRNRGPLHIYWIFNGDMNS